MSENISLEKQSLGAPFAPLGVAASFGSPEDVVNDRRLTTGEKKTILASWCSDARAVENAPTLRQIDSGAIVEVDEILRALAALDAAPPQPKPAKWLPFAPRGRNVITRWLGRARGPAGSNDNDDDPPPAPAGFAIPFRPTFVAAHAARSEQFRAAASG